MKILMYVSIMLFLSLTLVTCFIWIVSHYQHMWVPIATLVAAGLMTFAITAWGMKDE